MTRRADLRMYALGMQRARVQMSRELAAFTARIEAEFAELHRELRAVRGEVSRLHMLQTAVESERDFGASLH
jgi:hypothetical protein